MVSYHRALYQKKIMIQSWENLVMYGRTDRQTDESDLIGRCPTNVERPTKKCICFISLLRLFWNQYTMQWLYAFFSSSFYLNRSWISQVWKLAKLVNFWCRNLETWFEQNCLNVKGLKRTQILRLIRFYFIEKEFRLKS